MDLATLYFRLSATAPALGGQVLTIDGRPIRFLHQSLLDRSQLSEVRLDSVLGPMVKQAFELELFAPWRLRMLVVTVEVRPDEDANRVKGMATRQLLDHFEQENCWPLYFYSCSSTKNERSRGFVANCLRGSQSLAVDRFPEEAGVRLIHDAKGFALTSDHPQPLRYQRLVLLYALALAYQEQLQSFIDRLRNTLSDGQDAALARVREESTRFNALYYFDNPVPAATGDLRKSWRTLADSFGLRDTYQDFERQMNAVTQVVALRGNNGPVVQQAPKSQQPEPRELSRVCKCGVAGQVTLAILLLLLLLLTLVDLTPDKVAAFWQAWSDW